MNKRLNQPARNIIALAEQQARSFNHEYIGTEHILLGLVEGSDAVAAALTTLGVQAADIRNDIEKTVHRGSAPSTARKLPLTPRANRAVQCAADEVSLMNETEVGPEHLL